MQKAMRGFSLIEVLIAVGIIGILVAILMPVFSKAREKTNQAKCIMHQKQIILAVQLYTQENDKTYPPAVTFWNDVKVQPAFKKCPNSSGLIGYMFNSMLDGASVGLIREPDKTFVTADSNQTIGGYVQDVDKRHVFSEQTFIASFADGHVAMGAKTDIVQALIDDCQQDPGTGYQSAQTNIRMIGLDAPGGGLNPLTTAIAAMHVEERHGYVVNTSGNPAAITYTNTSLGNQKVRTLTIDIAANRLPGYLNNSIVEVRYDTGNPNPTTNNLAPSFSSPAFPRNGLNPNTGGWTSISPNWQLGKIIAWGFPSTTNAVHIILPRPIVNSGDPCPVILRVTLGLEQ